MISTQYNNREKDIKKRFKLPNLNTAFKAREKRSNPRFPPEVWEHIFRQLSVKNLLAVRRTCIQFKLIIDQCPSLMKRFLVRVPEDSTVDCEHFRVIMQLKNLSSLDVRKMSISDGDLQTIGQELPKLRNLALTVGMTGTPHVPNFLDTIPKLESVAIWGTDRTAGNLNAASQKQKLHFQSIENKTLIKLQFAEVSIARNDLQDLFTKCSHIRQVNFFGCQFDSWANVAKLTQSLNSLESLSISVSQADNKEYTLTKQFTNLKYLRFVGGNISKTSFMTLLKACPSLEQVSLMFVREYVDDTMMQVLCEKLPKLKKLSIYDCHITDASMKFIREHCPTLKRLRIDSCHNVSTEAKNMLQNSGIQLCTYISPYAAVRLNRL